jgi:hypothetical protein
MIAASQGNTELLNFSKTAFLCSRKIPASVVFAAKWKRCVLKMKLTGKC